MQPGEARVSLEVGVGSVDVIVPRGVAIRIEAEDDSWFTSIDFHGMRLIEIDDDIHESDDFDRADDRITFVVEVGMGSVDLAFPYASPLEQIPVNDNGSATFPAEWYFAATAAVPIPASQSSNTRCRKSIE